MREIISNARKTVVPRPTVEKSMERIACRAVELVRERADKYGQVSGVELGGSYAKGTWLGGKTDLDIFVKFERSTPSDEFVKISQDIGFDAMKDYEPSVRYSEHPFVEAKIQQTKINVVPCYVVGQGGWKSAADRSPYHTTYMRNSLDQRMRNEVRILKAFLISGGLYGAEIARRGISGYVSEVLILHFKSFENTVRSVASMKENSVIGEAGKKFNTPIVIIDPVDSKRNLAAAISKENMGRFVLRCRAFQRKPNLKFFTTVKPKKPKIRFDNVVVIKFRFSPRSPEIIWGQVQRATSSLAIQLGVEGFNVLRSGSYTDEERYAYLFFLLESVNIPDVRINVGPEFFMERYSDQYIRKNVEKSKLMWIDHDGRVVSLEKREFSDARRCLKKLIRGCHRTGLPKGLRDDFNKGFSVGMDIDKLDKPIKEAVYDLISIDGTFFHFD